ncbi:MAG TPA: sensor histidine kinase [Candidatus Dormibacteraeota bacterium]|nr:sensor histidine kinase [Candidatus Dormibacteraeota bacterium]
MITARMGRLRSYWRDRFGLRARMTASYVLVTAAAVIVVEAVAIAFTIPSLLANQDLVTRVRYTASAYAEAAASASSSATQLVLPSGYVLGQSDPSLGPGKVRTQGYGLEIPQIPGIYPDGAGPLSLALLFSSTGQVLASSYPTRYPVGSSAFNVIPYGPKSTIVGSTGQISDVSGGQVAWVVMDVVQVSGKPLGSVKSIDAYVYVQAPVQTQTIGSFAAAEPLLLPGLIVLLLAVPVGTLFGLLTTRGVVRRLRRLAGTTASFADGDFAQRVAPGASDEVGKLERNFNEMASRLQAAVARERQLAEKSARLAERSRISRELHDSISQDLFSLSLLAGGLERALPADSPVRVEVQTLAETVQSTNREMRALLLELRPTTLDEKGLVPALQELASNYSARLGINVHADLEPVEMVAAAELAALRIAQEGLANAIKHAHATTIRLGLHRRGDFAEITVSDDGQGFVANGDGHGLGLRLMRERVDELGGSLRIDSREGGGTTISAALPVASS